MKKTTRVLVALLALTLVTSCFVGGTFAKYVTDGQGTDHARVAKFGVEVTATGEAFKMAYDVDGDAATVKATEKVVAPGTAGNLAAVAVTGTPEVDVAVSYEANLALAGWEVEGAYYCPLEITVGTETFKGTAYASAAEFETAVEAAILAKAATYKNNTDLSAVNDDVQVSWAWAFEGNDNVKDTALGDAAADDNAATIDLTVKTIVTQID